jgi:hypothetical protein
MLLSTGRSILWLIAALGLIAGHPLTFLPTAPAQDDEPTIVRVVTMDHEFDLDGTIVPAGRVRFEVTNISETTRHEVFIYPIEQRDAPGFGEMLHLKRTGERASERDYLNQILGISGEVQAGDSATFEVVLPPGLYELGCFARDAEGDEWLVHYDHGMFANLVVI